LGLPPKVLDEYPVFAFMLKVMTTESEILRFIGQHGALKDSELARLLGVTHQQVNQAARGLAVAGVIARVPGPDGVIRNRRKTPGEPPPPLHEPSHRAVTTPSPKPPPVHGRVAAGAPVTRQDLSELGFEEHHLQRVPSADVPEAGLIGWNTLGHVPDAPGLYCFVGQQNPPGDLRVFYVGMTSHLWMVAKGQLPGGVARGGQRYGRPKHAGATRQRVNAEVARMSTDGWTFSHWLRAVEAPVGTPALETLLRAEEARLINIWDLRVVGWNRA
jgi:predicted ArsR family transcriptional regulator